MKLNSTASAIGIKTSRPKYKPPITARLNNSVESAVPWLSSRVGDVGLIESMSAPHCSGDLGRRDPKNVLIHVGFQTNKSQRALLELCDAAEGALASPGESSLSQALCLTQAVA